MAHIKLRHSPYMIQLLTIEFLCKLFAEVGLCFLQVYIEDALGERVWVDRADCKGFTDNIVTAFNTNVPKGGLSNLDTKTDQTSG